MFPIDHMTYHRKTTKPVVTQRRHAATSTDSYAAREDSVWSKVARDLAQKAAAAGYVPSGDELKTMREFLAKKVPALDTSEAKLRADGVVPDAYVVGAFLQLMRTESERTDSADPVGEAAGWTEPRTDAPARASGTGGLAAARAARDRRNRIRYDEARGVVDHTAYVAPAKHPGTRAKPYVAPTVREDATAVRQERDPGVAPPNAISRVLNPSKYD